MTTVQQRRQQLKADTRTAILEAARQLFLQADGFSMRQLAAEVGCSPAALYLHFRNKGELLEELMRQSFAILFQDGTVEERPGEDPVERIRRGMGGYVRIGLQHPEEYRLAFLTPLPEAQARRTPNPAFEAVQQRVRRCLEMKRFARPAPRAGLDANAALIAQALWTAVHGVTSLLILRPDFPWVRREALIERAISGAVDSLER